MCTRAAQHDQTHKVLTTDQKKLDFVANFQQKVQNPKGIMAVPKKLITSLFAARYEYTPSAISIPQYQQKCKSAILLIKQKIALGNFTKLEISLFLVASSFVTAW
jgi:hypothetical protein